MHPKNEFGAITNPDLAKNVIRLRSSEIWLMPNYASPARFSLRFAMGLPSVETHLPPAEGFDLKNKKSADPTGPPIFYVPDHSCRVPPLRTYLF